VKKDGKKTYKIKSLISSIQFWTGRGFLRVPARELSYEEKKELEFYRPMVKEIKLK